jgi:hypothetical protein
VVVESVVGLARAWPADAVQMAGKLGSPKKENKQQTVITESRTQDINNDNQVINTFYDLQTTLTQRKENV